MASHKYENLIKFSKETGIPVKKILELLIQLNRVEKVKNTEITSDLGLSKASINLIQKSFPTWFKPVSDYTQLSDRGKDAATLFIETDYLIEDAQWNFLLVQEDNILQDTEDFFEKRPSSDRNLDQFHATFETTARRAALMNFFEDLKYKRTLFLGDDDFTSIAIASLKKGSDITVVDADKRILDTIKKISLENGFQIKTELYDAKNPLPKDLQGTFDVVFTDPPYTTKGVELFASRSIQALDFKNKASRIYICYGNSDLSKEKFLPIYEVFFKSGLMIRHAFDKFNRYTGADSIGNCSTLFICDTTNQTKPLIKNKYLQNIYTNES